MTTPKRRDSSFPTIIGVTAVVGMVTCCALFGLVAGGALAFLGPSLRTPAVIAAGVAVAAGSVIFA